MAKIYVTESEFMERVRIKCIATNVRLLEVGNFNGNKTKLKLQCIIDDNIWENDTIHTFLRRNTDSVKCESCKLSAISKTFMDSGKFLDGTTFTKSSKVSYYNLNCPICSNDDYVKNGLCNGIFTSRYGTLKRGGIPCRCSKSFIYTKEQQEFRLKKILDSENCEFISWKSEYKNQLSKFVWKCSKGHICENSTLNRFLLGCRCLTCREIAGSCNGRMPLRGDETDNLYIMKFDNCIKVGRSFKVDDRLNDLMKASNNKCKPIILRLYEGKHNDIYSIEQLLHNSVDLTKFKQYNVWSTETYILSSEKYIYEILEKYNNLYKIERIYNDR